MAQTRARWRRTDGTWAETLLLDVGAGGLVADGEILATPGDQAPWLVYRIETDRDSCVSTASVARSDGVRVALHADNGRWRRADTDTPLDELEGCLDIDLEATPFTNTLPIRRLVMRAGEHAQIEVVYVDHATLSVRRREQDYTCIQPYQTGEGCYRYHSDGFEAELRVDAVGLVLDYPPFWNRVT